jgi:hypothetical protein
MKAEKEILRVKDMAGLTELMLQGVTFNCLMADDLFRLSGEVVEKLYDLETTGNVAVCIKSDEDGKVYYIPKAAIFTEYIRPTLVRLKPLDKIIDELNGQGEVELSVNTILKHLAMISLGEYARLYESSSWLDYDDVAYDDGDITLDGYIIPSHCLEYQYEC